MSHRRNLLWMALMVLVAVGYALVAIKIVEAVDAL